MPNQPLTLRAAYQFFLPLTAMAEMMMLSHSIVHGFLARTSDPTTTLAAYNAAFSFQTTLGSPIWAGLLIALGFIKDRQSLLRLLTFNLYIIVGLVIIDLMVVFTELGDLLYGDWMGLEPTAVGQAKIATLTFVVVMPVVSVRNIASALIMFNRRTILITIGTMVRVCALVTFLFVFSSFLTGALIGALAHTMCLIAETLMMTWVAKSFYFDLPKQSAPKPRYADIWRFGWPLMMNNMTETGIALTINLFLGRFAQPTLAVAAFGVLHGLLKLLLSPLRNLTQTVQTMVKKRSDYRLMYGFAWQVTIIFFGLLYVLFCTPLSHTIFNDLMGLPTAIQDYIQPTLWPSLLLPVFWAHSTLFCGFLAVLRYTTPIGISSIIRWCIVFGAGLIVIAMGTAGQNGALFGVLALVAAFATDTSWLGFSLWRRLSTSPIVD